MTAVHVNSHGQTVEEQRQTPPDTGRPPRRSGRPADLRQRFWRDRAFLVMAMPGMVILLVFYYLPVLGNVVAFQDYLPYIGIRDSAFVGLANFRELFTEPAFWVALRNTLEISLCQLLLFFPIPIMLALLLHSIASTTIRRIVQSVVYLPHFVSWVIVVALFQQVLGSAGYINDFLRDHGASTFEVMTNPDLFTLLVTAQVIWKDAGWGTIIILAALSTIDEQLYESSAVDGAGRWRRMWHVTLPGIRPVIILLLILRLGEVLSVGFEQILLQRNAVGATASEVLDTFSYYHGVVNGAWGVAAAAGLFKGVVGLVLILAANKAAHALGEQGVYSK